MKRILGLALLLAACGGAPPCDPCPGVPEPDSGLACSLGCAGWVILLDADSLSPANCADSAADFKKWKERLCP